jgi:hypothetical protein
MTEQQMAKRSAAVALALAGVLAGCATPTAYQPRTPGHASSGGYSEIRVEPNRWRVTFSGNTLTSRETVETYLLYRAAELTTQQGYDWFSIVDRDTENKGYTYISSYGPYWGWRPSWRFHRHGFGRRVHGFGGRGFDPFWGDPFWADSIDVRTVDRFEATAEITARHGAKPANDPRAFDARQVIANLQPRIRYPEPKK